MSFVESIISYLDNYEESYIGSEDLDPDEECAANGRRVLQRLCERPHIGMRVSAEHQRKVDLMMRGAFNSQVYAVWEK